jgi:Ner family transcriptional regulator
MRKAEPWHRVDIVAAVWKKGSTLRRLSVENGFAHSTLRASLDRMHPRAHDIIAKFIGKPRQSIWPNFYHADGKRRTTVEVRRFSILEQKSRKSA